MLDDPADPSRTPSAGKFAELRGVVPSEGAPALHGPTAPTRQEVGGPIMLNCLGRGPSSFNTGCSWGKPGQLVTLVATQIICSLWFLWPQSHSLGPCS